MSILSYLSYFNKQATHDYIAREVVDTCLPILTSDLQKAAGTSAAGSAEYRGYVRARANWLVDNAVDDVMTEFQVRVANRKTVCSIAVERLVGCLAEECTSRAA